MSGAIHWVLFVYCDCATSGVPYVMLPLFALAIAYAVYRVMQAKYGHDA